MMNPMKAAFLGWEYEVVFVDDLDGPRKIRLVFPDGTPVEVQEAIAKNYRWMVDRLKASTDERGNVQPLRLLRGGNTDGD